MGRGIGPEKFTAKETFLYRKVKSNMMNTPRISVVLATYNGEKHVGEQLKSILNQSRKPNEIIIVDDCSTDGTVGIVKQLVNDSTIDCKLIVNKKNIGWRSNFINGFHQTTGDLIFCSDQDDIWYTNKLEIMEKILVENPSINVLASNFSPFYEKRATKLSRFYKEKIGSTYISKVNYQDYGMSTLRPGCTIGFRSTMVDLIDKIWVDCLPHDGVIWVVGLMTDSAYVVNEPLIHYRRHGNNNSPSNQKRIKPRLDHIECNRIKIQNILENAELLQLDQEKEKYLQSVLHLSNIRIKAYSERNILLLLKHRHLFSKKTVLADILSIING